MWLARLAPQRLPRWMPRPIALPADRYHAALSALEQMIDAFDGLERDLADGRPLEELARSWVSPSLITVWARAVGAASASRIQLSRERRFQLRTSAGSAAGTGWSLAQAAVEVGPPQQRLRLFDLASDRQRYSIGLFRSNWDDPHDVVWAEPQSYDWRLRQLLVEEPPPPPTTEQIAQARDSRRQSARECRRHAELLRDDLLRAARWRPLR